MTTSKKNYRDIPANYYLLGCYFSLEKNDFGKDVFPTWSTEADLTGELLLKNVKPLVNMPVAVNLDSLKPTLWGSNEVGQLMVLSNKREKIKKITVVTNTDGNDTKPQKSADEYIALRKESPVNSLVLEQYKLSFPPLTLLASLATINKTSADICSELAGIVKTIGLPTSPTTNSLSSAYSLTSILPSQLAEEIKPETNGYLKPEDKVYNDWRKKMVEKGEPIQGFLLPLVHCCAVVFSHADYARAEVTLHRMKPNNDTGEVELINVGSPQKVEVKEGGDINRPCAVFNLDPTSFIEGIYSINVSFSSANYDGIIPEWIAQANITEHNVDGEISYEYTLREQICFHQSTPVGKIAIVCGDMISLEESLIYQFPQELSAIEKYITDSSSKNTAKESLGQQSIGLLKAIGKSAEGEFHSMNSSGLKDYAKGLNSGTFLNIGKTFWGELDQNNLPESMVASAELVFGIHAIPDALKELKTKIKLDSKASYTAPMRVEHFLRSNVINMKVLNKELTNVKDMIGKPEAEKYKSFATKIAPDWFRNYSSKMGKILPVVGAVTSMSDFYSDYKDMQGKQLSAIGNKDSFEDIAADYLEKVPVWSTEQKSPLEKLNQAIGEFKAKEDSNNKQVADSAVIKGDERGLAAFIQFHFNERQETLETEQSQTLIGQIVELVKENKDVIVEIDGHACQVGQQEQNEKVAKERALNTHKAFLADLPEGHEKQFIVNSFGESKTIVDGSDAYTTENRADSAAVAANRRVEIRVYLPVFSLIFPPSRTGSKALEKARLVYVLSLLDIDEAQKKLMLTTLQGVMGAASFVPIFAPLIAGVMLVQTAVGIAESGISLLDNLLFENQMKNWRANLEKEDHLSNLAKVNLKMLNDVKDINTSLMGEFTNYEDLKAHLDNPNVQKELLKRYKLRALSMNGLMLIILHISNKHGQNITQDLVERYKLEDYVKRYIMSDDWSVMAGQRGLAQWWIASIEQSPRMRGYSTALNGNVSGAFNKVFPIQTKLFEQDIAQENKDVFTQFVNNFNIRRRDLLEKDIGFCRMLICAPNETKWVTYTDWLEPGRSNRLSPFHKIKWQIVLSKKASENGAAAFFADIHYQRKDILDVTGPSFEVLFFPHTRNDFSGDCDSEIKSYYSKEFGGNVDDKSALLAAEFDPSYWFGEHCISGMKPLMSKEDFDMADFFWSMQALVSDSKSGFERYVEEGRLRQMRYQFNLVSKSNNIIPLSYSVKYPKYKQMRYGIHDNRSTDINYYDGAFNFSRKINESDLLIENFVMSTNSKKAHSHSALEDLGFTSIAIEYDNRLTMLKDDCELNQFDWSAEKPASVYVMLVGKKLAKDAYEIYGQDLSKVAVSMQLALSKESGAFELFSDLYAGPTYHTDMHYIGELAYSEYNANSNKKYDENKDVYIEIYNNKLQVPNEFKEFVELSKDKINSTEHELGTPKEHFHVYVMKFDLFYISPTGKKISGLRPFGDIKSGNTITETFLSFAHLSQTNTDKVTEYPLPTSNFKLPSHYFRSPAPWGKEVIGLAKNIDRKAATYYHSLDEKAQNEWKDKWIKDHPTNVNAPKPTSIS